MIHRNAIDKYIRRYFRARVRAPSVNYLPCTQEEDLSSNFRTYIKMMDVVARPSTREVEKEEGSLRLDS